jgi:hypothetical protein
VIGDEFARCDVAFVRDGGVMATIYATLPIPDATAHGVLDDPSLSVMQGKKRLDTRFVITLDTLVGANDAAEIVDYGSILAHLARRLVADSDTWRRLVTDPVTGHLLDYGTTTYKPPTALCEYVIARDRHCRFPGCTTAGWRDLDHVDPWTGTSEGGQTSADNLITLCRRHHQDGIQTRVDSRRMKSLLPHWPRDWRMNQWMNDVWLG